MAAKDFQELIKAQQETTKALMSAEEAARYDAILAERQLEFNKKSEAVKAGLEAKKAKDNKDSEDKQQAATEASGKEAAIDNKKLLDIQKKPALLRTAEEQGIFLEENNRKIEEKAKADGIAFKDTKTWQDNQDAIALNNLKIREEEAGKDISASTQKEIDDERTKLQEKNQGLLGKIAGGIGGLKEQGMAKVKSAGKGVMAILKTTLIAGFALALVAFLNSPYWEKTKTVIIDDVLPALKNVFNFLKDVIVPPLVELFGFIKDEIFPIIKDVFIKSWESIKKVFSGIGEAFDKFSEGDILGGITTLFGSLGTFFLETLDNMITGIFNLLGAVFGFEGTDSVGGSIMKFFTDIKNKVVSSFIAMKDFLAESVDIVIESIKGAFTGIFVFFKDLFDFSDMSIFEGFMKFIDIVYLPLNLAINFLKNLFNFGNPNEPFRLSDFLFGPEGIVSKAVQAIKDIFPSFEDLKAMLPSPSKFLNMLNPFSSDNDVEVKTTPTNVVNAAMAGNVAGRPDFQSLMDTRAKQMTEAKLDKATGQGTPVVVNAPSTNVVNSSTSSSATHMNTAMANPNPTVAALNLSY
jgi:hypothetical protein